MKIALIRQDYHKHGGAERYVYHLSGELARRGHEVHIFAHTGKEEVHRLNKLNNSMNSSNSINFHRVPVVGGAAFLKTLSFALFSRRQLKKAKFDIIHSFDRTLYQDVYRAGDGCHREWLSRSLKIASNGLSRMMVRLNPLHLTLLFLEKRIFKKCKRIIAIAKIGKEEIIKHYGVNSGRITVIYNGVDSDEFNPGSRELLPGGVREQFNLSQDDFVILFVGSGWRRKGLSYLIKAVALLDREKVKLLIVGKDGKRPYSHLVRRLGLEGKVIFIGGTSEAANFYSSGDVFVLPTLYEPFGNVCLEALATGLPIIISKCAGAAEIITDGKNGLLLNNPMDPEEIARKIRMTFDDELRDKLGSNARLLAEKFTLSKNAEETLEVYNEIITNYEGTD